MITEKQKDNVYHLPIDDLIELDKVIQDRLGTMTPTDFLPLFKGKRNWLYNQCKLGIVKSKQIGNKFFPYANVYLDKI